MSRQECVYIRVAPGRLVEAAAEMRRQSIALAASSYPFEMHARYPRVNVLSCCEVQSYAKPILETVQAGILRHPTGERCIIKHHHLRAARRKMGEQELSRCAAVAP